MKDHLVAFVDLLGFSDIIRKVDDTRQGIVLRLLESLANATGDHTLESVAIDNETKQIKFRPAISAFSDLIVFSFPSDKLDQVGAGPIVLYLAQSVGHIFKQAFDVNCLIRGGIAFGPLYHAGGVVFGPALVQAYELESKFAKWPRIICSPDAARHLGSNPYLQSDEDRFVCLDYVRGLYDQVPYDFPTERTGMTSKNAWTARI